MTKLRERYREFRYIPYPHTYITFPIITITHQNSTFSTKDEPTLTHHNHPKSLVYLRAHPLCCMLLGLDKCMTPIHHYDTIRSIFTALKILCALPVHLSSTPTPDNHWYFYCPHRFAFSRMLQSWNHTVCSLFRLTSFNMYLSLLHAFSWLDSSFLLIAE